MRKGTTFGKVVFQPHLVRIGVIGATLVLILLAHGTALAGQGMIPPGTAVLLLDGLLLALGMGAYIGVGRLLRLLEESRDLKLRLQESERSTAEAYQRLGAVFRTSQRFAEASDEGEIIELLLNLSIELVGAKGVSFVPLDERGQALPAMSRGELPYPEADAWVEYLASPAVRHQCGTCKEQDKLVLSCPLIQGSYSGSVGIYCLPLRRGEREYGVLNLYIPQPGGLDPETQAILRTIVDETTLALEGVRLRKREIQTLHQLQAVREKTDLKTMLSSLLSTIQDAVEADFVMICLKESGPDSSQDEITSEELPEQTRYLVDGILQSVYTSARPVLLGSVAGELSNPPGFRSLLAVPLGLQAQPVLGVLLVANRRPESFNQRQLSVLQTIGGQVAMVVKNYDLVAELEFKTMIEERTRLAREIHDGLAQTLGFLKLKTAQMGNYLDRGELDLLRRTVNTCYESLAEAYQDARQAIDGLRISSFDSGISGWLRQTVDDLQEYNELTIHLCEPIADVSLTPEVHAQLIRIVQEALSNIRKHARASQVWISCKQDGRDLVLEIRDDGKGFYPEEVPGPSQHGLRGMRERAELIGADFQIIGGPQLGTTVRVSLPLQVGEGVR